jgi:hypothetical protein
MLTVGRGNRVRRTRPQIPTGWKTTVTFEVDDDVVKTPDQTVTKWMSYGSKLVGLMGWRPTFGRFEVESCEVL